MAVNFNHTIVSARDSAKSAAFLADILSLPAPKRWGPFHGYGRKHHSATLRLSRQ